MLYMCYLSIFINRDNIIKDNFIIFNNIDLSYNLKIYEKIKYFIDDKYTDVQAIISLSTKYKKITIIFRGIESKTDWFYNINTRLISLTKENHLPSCFKNIIKDRYKNIKVHNGYYKQLIKHGIYNKLVNYINSLLSQFDEYNNYDIFITGHSAGGALATLTGYFLSHDLSNKNINIISFGSPRVGNYNFKNDFEKIKNLSHYRVINNKDIIAAIPYFYYYHTGYEIKLIKNNIYYNKKSTIYNYIINDHLCKEYFTNILNNIKLRNNIISKL